MPWIGSFPDKEVLGLDNHGSMDFAPTVSPNIIASSDLGRPTLRLMDSGPAAVELHNLLSARGFEVDRREGAQQRMAQSASSLCWRSSSFNRKWALRMMASLVQRHGRPWCHDRLAHSLSPSSIKPSREQYPGAALSRSPARRPVPWRRHRSRFHHLTLPGPALPVRSVSPPANTRRRSAAPQQRSGRA